MAGVTSKDILFSRVVSSPSELLHAIKSMTPRQKEVIADMGFESLLQIGIAEIPTTLAFYVVTQLDTVAMVIRTRSGEIPVNREAVCRVYGFPMGNTIIEHSKSSKYNDATTTLWKEHLGNPDVVRPKDLVKTIKGSRSTDFMFKVDFLVLMVSTLVCAMKNGRVYQRFIQSLKPTSVIKEFDWCEFVVEAVKGCKEDWRPHDNHHPFVGPLTFLVLLYCDHVRVAPEIERVRPVIVGWTSKDLKERQKNELCGGFASGELLHETEEVGEVGAGEDNDNEQTEHEVVESVEKALDHVGKLICDAFSRFGDNEKLQSIKNKWDSAFSEQGTDFLASVSEEIRSLSPDPSQNSITWPSGGILTLGWVTNLMLAFDRSSKNLMPSNFPTVLPVEVFDALIVTGSKILHKEPNCVEVEPADKDVVVVVGDVHGQLHDLLFLLKEAGPPSQDRFFVFNGDYVDRGAWGLETFLILLAWKVFLPKQVFLLRGNHEAKYCTKVYGFEKEVLAKYGDNNVGKHVYRKCLGCFQELPLASIIAGCVYTAHGGLFRHMPPKQAKRKRRQKIKPIPESVPLSLGSLEELSKVRRTVLDPPWEGQNLIPGDVLWSDPTVEQGLSPNTERGLGLLWGPDCTEAFLKNSKLKLIIRSHEGPDARDKRPGLGGMDKGYTIDHEVKYGKLITVFSAPDYPQFQATEERYNNEGAYIELKSPKFDTPIFHSFKAVTPRPEVESYYNFKDVIDSDEELDLSMMESSTSSS